MKKNIIFIVVGLTVAVFLFSGGVQDETTTEPKEPATLHWLLWLAVPDVWPDKLIEDFESKNPNIKIEFESPTLGVADYLQQQKVRLLSGSDLDLTSIRPESLEPYSKAGHLLDLTDRPFLKNIKPYVLDKVMIGGRVYSIPSKGSTVAVYYNKDMFKEYGLLPPTTWNEFLDVCEALKTEGETPLLGGGKDAWPMEYDIYPIMHDVGAKNPDIYDKVKAGDIKYTDVLFINTFKKINEFYQKQYIGKETLSIGYLQSITVFKQKKSAILILGDWALKSVIGGEEKPPFEIDIFPLPHNSAGEEKVGVLAVGASLGIASTSKQTEEALKFADYMCSLDAAKINIETGYEMDSVIIGGPPSQYPLADKWIPMFNFKKSVPYFYSLQSPNANNEFLKQLQLLFLNKTTPEKMAEQIQLAEERKAD
ncbi:MAG: carbohydrate ABC transporter substrate-binding protein [Spirochaetaceae bacterium]|nr:MAG: carbohydrate ABC transporter substrate-binding protein [Spirochaetaceae bacterium]